MFLFVMAEQWSFVHIPKTAGASVIVDAGKLNALYPKDPVGKEHGSLYDRAKRPSSKHLVMLRSPRTHVISQYAECRYDKWGKKVTTTDFPRSGTFENDFKKWLRAREDFDCYHPQDMQTRYLSSRRYRPHDYEPANLTLALKQLETMDWVGLVEFYHVSLCVLASRVNATCARPTRERHYKERPPRVLDDPEIVDLIDNLTVLDRQLVNASLPIFFNQVNHLGYRIFNVTHTPLDYIRNLSDLYLN